MFVEFPSERYFEQGEVYDLHIVDIYDFSWLRVFSTINSITPKSRLLRGY